MAGCLLLLAAGCSDAPPDAHGMAGAANGGATASAGASGSTHDGGSTAEAGAPASTGGASGSSLGGAPSTSDCPPWPRDRLMPTIGPLFYGPDPGPCTETVSSSPLVSAYSYDDSGRVTKVVTGTSTRTEQWTDGTLTSVTYLSSSGSELVITYTWKAASVTETVPGVREMVQEYELDAAGYPKELWLTDPSSGTRRRGASYTYVDCRLTHRDAFDADGSLNSQTADYEYDAAGHMSARNNKDGTKTKFDYSCW